MTSIAALENLALDLRIAGLFDQCFADSHRCVLRGGADEPFYQPRHNGESLSVIYYREDFVRSALHEVAHWCIAGEARRQQPDYGYWYEPDGRDAQQQRLFESVERRPQALEWFFCLAADIPFSLSIDNLDGAPQDNFGFALAVWQQARSYLRDGLPARAARFQQSLAAAFGSGQPSAAALSLAVLYP